MTGQFYINHCHLCYVGNILRTTLNIETVKTLFKLTSWTNWHFLYWKIIKTG